MAKYWSETVIALKLVWLRVVLYFLFPSITTFLALTETWSGDTWDNTHAFLKVRMFICCAVAGLGAFIAFLDQSLQRAKTEVANKKNADGATEFLTKPND